MAAGFERKVRAAALLPMVVGGAVRLLYAHWNVPDFWGDAYHHWLISRLTLANDWVYTDYKGLETIWLPCYHYLIAAAMTVSGRYDLAPAHLTNIVLGTLACGLVAKLTYDIIGDWRAGLVAGLTLALLPWHIAYSFINMPEVMGGVLLILTLLAARGRRTGVLAGLALLCALTRHELTLFLLFIGLWLGSDWALGGPSRLGHDASPGQRRSAGLFYRWQPLLAVVIASALGLGLWSAWSWQVNADPLSWWTRYRAATAWDAHYWSEAGVRLADLVTLAETLVRTFPPLVLVGPLILVSAAVRAWRERVPRLAWLLVALVSLHWLALGLGFVAGHLPSADPRYVLLTTPGLIVAGVIVVFAIPQRQTRFAVLGSYSALLALALVRQLQGFPDMAFALAPERAAGEYLGHVAVAEDKFWVDAPVAIYHSRLDPERFYSSDLLLPDAARWQPWTSEFAANVIVSHDVRFVLWEDVPYTFVQHAWPQMEAGLAFEQDGYRFRPVFRFTGWELEYGARLTVVWQIEPVENKTLGLDLQRWRALFRLSQVTLDADGL